MNESTHQQPRRLDEGGLDYLLVNLPNGVGLTFIGQCRDLDPQTVELCSHDGRAILQVPRQYVTITTQDETAQRIIEDARHRRTPLN